MARSRTTKSIAKRIDLTYFRHPNSLRRARILLIALCALASLAWIITASLRHTDSPHNPGRLASVHATFQQDCAQCHAGSPSSFFKTISDTACLKCHDGAIHHPSQLTFISFDHSRSANCTVCHIEHRGQDHLRPVSDQTCTQCHANITNSTQSNSPKIAISITNFSTADHPSFGRSLLKSGQWSDPTQLKFNHARHMPLKEISSNCLLCHTPASDGHYMQPINYSKHCQTCHSLDLPASGPRFTHDKLEIVRAQINSLPQLYLTSLLTDPQRESKLTLTIKEGRPPRVKITTKHITESEWVDQQLAALMTTINRSTTQPTSMPTTDPSATAAAIEKFVAFNSKNSCSLCHTLSGDLPSMAAAKSPPMPLLHTEPTGIPSTSRRWFPQSQFDHRAHRNLSCLQCHASAPSSTKTSDVLLPNIESCTTCHHPDTPASRGAPSNCITCHQFHDRSKERPPPVAIVNP